MYTHIYIHVGLHAHIYRLYTSAAVGTHVYNKINHDYTAELMSESEYKPIHVFKVYNKLGFPVAHIYRPV